MFRIKTLAAATLGLAVVGCASPPHQLEALNNPSLYSVHQPVVQRTDFVFDVATGPGGVPATEQARLNAWF
ncbi:MAG: CpaD family pilus assembly protein, partial [Allosphingosinicella sp.]